MAPPQFNKLTKSVSDLFKKDFGFGFSVQTTNKASKGLKFETEGNNNATGVAGRVKVDYDHSDFGKVELQMHTAGKDSDTNVKLTSTKLADGLEVSLAANAAPDLALEASFKQSQFAGQFKATTNLDSEKHSAGIFATLGSFSGLTFGAQVGAGLGSSGAVDVNKYDLGALYKFDDTQVGLVTGAKFDNITTSVFHKLDGDTNLGVRVSSALGKGSHKAEFGLQHKLSGTSSAKVKADLDGTVGISFVQKLSNPNAKFSFAHQRSLTSSKNEKFGIGLHFGDY
jgi:hypothetical protein